MKPSKMDPLHRVWGPSISQCRGASAVVGEWSSRSWLRPVVGASVVVALALFASGCGGGGSESSGGESEARAQLTSSRPTAAEERETAETRPVRLGVTAERRRALRLDVQVPYCVDGEPKPFIQRVERRHGRGGLVFTIFLRFGPEYSEFEGCAGVVLFLGKWVRVGDKSKPLFDGSTSPPSRRQLPP